MTELERASDRVCHAIILEDLDQVASALCERARLLKAGAEPTERALALGEEGARLLSALKQKLAIEVARRNQFLVKPLASPPRFEWRG